eukprot:TRINITY_DN55771_c0_g1_i1.p1 TRINITY_DN55771_c0_g1~~TRINITY_DN55771_c0_g1_i1.p1  ORF type:complete len:245 (+),score=13.60 TRINITY_DN55771_c0_g1_i1:47-781(+)
MQSPVREHETSEPASVSVRERCLEMLLALFTGLLFIGRLVQPEWVFILLCFVTWSSWIAFQRRKHGSAILVQWGFSCKPRVLWKSFFFASIVASVLLVALLVVCFVQGYPIVLTNWHLWVTFCIYPFWGVLQQFLIQAIFTRNMSYFFTSSETSTVLDEAIRIGTGKSFFKLSVCTLVPAAAFSAVHYPDNWLMAATGLLGIFWTPLYMHVRSLYPLGLYHGTVGTLFYFWFLQSDPLEGIQAR